MRLKFSSRQEWLAARSRKAQVSTRLSDYATAAEIVQLKGALVKRWNDLGKNHKGEELRSNRLIVRQALKRIECGMLPLLSEAVTEDLLAPLRARYEAAKTKAHDEIANDNDAWEAEMHRRSELNRRYGLNETQHTQKETHA